MSLSTSPILYYVRFAGSGAISGSLPLADLPAWEIHRQEFKTSGDGTGIELVEQVLATGLTLHRARLGLSAIAAGPAVQMSGALFGEAVGNLPGEEGGEKA